MDTQPSPENMPEHNAFDLFSYPRLYPSGWDLSEQDNRAPGSANAEPMPASYEPFRDLRTFPAGWDLS